VPVPETPGQGGADQPAAYQNGGDNGSSALFLIALKDHSIFPAIAYWVQDSTLNYISQQGVHNRVSLDQVDEEFSVQLNKERNVDFRLTPSN
jgi:hypothetical protein